MGKFLELFAGTRRMADTFAENGWETYTIEKFREHPRIDLYEDILQVSSEKILDLYGKPSVIWASPPCYSFSVSAIGLHRVKEPSGNLSPFSEFAKYSDDMVQHTLRLINELQPKYFFIENPRGGLRKMWYMRNIPRYTITYCQYDDFRQKPTDIWTNHPNPMFKMPCKRMMPCHEPAPRGSQTGTQGMDEKDRATIPKAFCKHIVEISKR